MDTALDLEYIIENTMAATYDVTFLLRTLPNFSFNFENQCLLLVCAAAAYSVLLFESKESVWRASLANYFFNCACHFLASRIFFSNRVAIDF